MVQAQQRGLSTGCSQVRADTANTTQYPRAHSPHNAAGTANPRRNEPVSAAALRVQKAQYATEPFVVGSYCFGELVCCRSAYRTPRFGYQLYIAQIDSRYVLPL